jgi:type I restriction enzyme M protein
MATGTNTVVLFLRRKNNAEHTNILASVNKAFETKTDITIKSIEKPLSKYISYVWENISFEDYLSLIENNPNENILNHQIYKSYITKHTINKILEIEKEKFFYFILAYNQKITLVKSGEKQDEKKFLGYEFSFRRGSEGIHAIQRAKSIDECTSLYDNNSYENLLKANSYVYSAFSGEEKSIDKSLKSNISYMNLVDMMEFSRVDFDKFISVNAKKKVKIESRWDLVKISSLCEIGRGRVISKKEIESNQGIYPVYSSQTSNDGIFGYLNSCDFDGEYVTWTTDGIYAGTCFYRNGKFNCTNVCGTLKNKSENLMTKFLPLILNLIAPAYVVKVANPKLMNNVMADIKIPLPPKDIQQKIINEIENLELFEKDSREKIEDLKNEIKNQINQSLGKEKTLSKICDMKAGKFVSASDIEDIKTLENYPCYGGNGLRGYTKTFTHEGTFSLIGRQGALCGNVHRVAGQFHATEHALVVTPFENIDTNWLYHKLKEMNLNQYATGVAQPGLSVKNLNDIYVLVPSFQEQQQIVKQIEDIENKIQNIEKELESIPTKKEEILKKYL